MAKSGTAGAQPSCQAGKYKKFQCYGSGMFIPDPNVFHPGSRVIRILDPGSGFTSKLFKYFNPKIVSKLSEIWSGMFIPDPDLDFFTHSGSLIQDPGVEKAPDPGSATLKKSTVLIVHLWWFGVYSCFFQYGTAGEQQGGWVK
jgi:hypothetical protein